MHALFGDLRIQAGDVGAGGDIEHNHFIIALDGAQLFKPGMAVVRLRFIGVAVEYRGGINTLRFKQIRLAVDHGHQLEVHAVAFFQIVFLFREQFQPA